MYDFINTILIVVETVLVICLITGVVGRIGDDRIIEILAFCGQMLIGIALVGAFLYLFYSASKHIKVKAKEKESLDVNTREVDMD